MGTGNKVGMGFALWSVYVFLVGGHINLTISAEQPRTCYLTSCHIGHLYYQRLVSYFTGDISCCLCPSPAQELKTEPDSRPESEENCPVCGDKVSGYHYGLLTCESCKVRRFGHSIKKI